MRYKNRSLKIIHTIVVGFLLLPLYTGSSFAITLKLNVESGATLASNMSICAVASGCEGGSDCKGSAKIQFQVDGVDYGAEGIARWNGYRVFWNTTSVANGNHTIRALAKDTATQERVEAVATVNVANDTRAPSICGANGVADVTSNLVEADIGKPPKGTIFTDDKFGTCVSRITDNSELGVRNSVQSYSRLQAWNADQTLILLNSSHILDARTYQVVHRFASRWPSKASAPRWSPTDPHVIYYLGNLISGHKDPDGIACPPNTARFMRYRLKPGRKFTAKRELVGCFQEYTDFHKDSSWEEMSNDGRFVSLVGKLPSGNFEAFIYNVPSKEKGPVLSLKPNSFDWTAISPQGKYVVIAFKRPDETFKLKRGVQAFYRDQKDALGQLKFAGQVSLTLGHGDITVGADGEEYLIQTNASNPYLLSEMHHLIRARIPNGVVYSGGYVPGAKLDSTASLHEDHTVPLLTLDWFQGNHTSCRNDRSEGWCVVSTYSGGCNGWQPFEREVFKLYLDSRPDNPHVERLAHHRSDFEYVASAKCPKSQSYLSQPHATVSHDGKMIMFGSSWGTNCGAEAYVIRTGSSGGVPLSNSDSIPPVPSMGLTDQLRGTDSFVSQLRYMPSKKNSTSQQIGKQFERLKVQQYEQTQRLKQGVPALFPVTQKGISLCSRPM